MNTGTIILIPFPFAELTGVKVRPALVVCETKDKYNDLILCAISSVLPMEESDFQMILQPNKENNLRVPSVLKIDRIVTLKKEAVITTLGSLSELETISFKEKFRQLVN
ncbi:MAG: PemK family protein [Flavipsychrobacter sp.]|jgi:mRNA interferase MazF|nr:PemK family protein [Flavipsychrobacter sp.]